MAGGSEFDCAGCVSEWNEVSAGGELYTKFASDDVKMAINSLTPLTGTRQCDITELFPTKYQSQVVAGMMYKVEMSAKACDEEITIHVGLFEGFDGTWNVEWYDIPGENSERDDSRRDDSRRDDSTRDDFVDDGDCPGCVSGWTEVSAGGELYTNFASDDVKMALNSLTPLEGTRQCDITELFPTRY